MREAELWNCSTGDEHRRSDEPDDGVALLGAEDRAVRVDLNLPALQRAVPRNASYQGSSLSLN